MMEEENYSRALSHFILDYDVGITRKYYYYRKSINSATYFWTNHHVVEFYSICTSISIPPKKIYLIFFPNVVYLMNIVINVGGNCLENQTTMRKNLDLLIQLTQRIHSTIPLISFVLTRCFWIFKLLYFNFLNFTF